MRFGPYLADRFIVEVTDLPSSRDLQLDVYIIATIRFLPVVFLKNLYLVTQQQEAPSTVGVMSDSRLTLS